MVPSADRYMCNQLQRGRSIRSSGATVRPAWPSVTLPRYENTASGSSSRAGRRLRADGKRAAKPTPRFDRRAARSLLNQNTRCRRRRMDRLRILCSRTRTSASWSREHLPPYRPLAKMGTTLESYGRPRRGRLGAAGSDGPRQYGWICRRSGERCGGSRELTGSRSVVTEKRATFAGTYYEVLTRTTSRSRCSVRIRRSRSARAASRSDSGSPRATRTRGTWRARRRRSSVASRRCSTATAARSAASPGTSSARSSSCPRRWTATSSAARASSSRRAPRTSSSAARPTARVTGV